MLPTWIWVRPSTGQFIKDQTCEESRLFPNPAESTVKSYSLWAPPPWWHANWSCLTPLQATTATDFIRALTLSCAEDTVSQCSFPTSGSYHISSPFLSCSLGWKGVFHCVSYSLYLDQLWVSVLTTIHCKKKFLWWGLRASLIWEYKKYLGTRVTHTILPRDTTPCPVLHSSIFSRMCWCLFSFFQ